MITIRVSWMHDLLNENDSQCESLRAFRIDEGFT
jgi:hypothetical protein